MARFLLELRAVYLNESPHLGSFDSKITFVEVMLGNMGASLNSSWITGDNKHRRIERSLQFSDIPLGVGLLRPYE